MSLSRFLGREPVETHRTEHPDGSVTVTTVTREPEFTDADREALYALHFDDLERCPECGNPRSVCSQFPDEGYFPQRSVCWVSAVRRVAERKFERLHENARPDASGFLPTDGVRIWASVEDLTPDDDFLSGAPEQGAQDHP